MKKLIVIAFVGLLLSSCEEFSSPQPCHADNMLTLEWWQNCI